MKHPDYYEDEPKTVKVESGRVDVLLPGEVFDVIIMDVGGSEYFAMQGMPRILGSAQLLQIDFHPHHLRKVAGVGVKEFAALIEPHFQSLCIARKRLVVPRAQFVPILMDMYQRDAPDESLIFCKSPPASIRFEE